jgi:hypothetical protein
LRFASLPETLLACIFYCLKPSEVARISVVATIFNATSASRQYWNGMFEWQQSWLQLRRTDLFEHNISLALRQDPTTTMQFIYSFYEAPLADFVGFGDPIHLDTGPLDHVRRGRISLFDIANLWEKRPLLFHHLFSRCGRSTYQYVLLRAGLDTGTVPLVDLVAAYDAMPDNVRTTVDHSSCVRRNNGVRRYDRQCAYNIIAAYDATNGDTEKAIDREGEETKREREREGKRE